MTFPAIGALDYGALPPEINSGRIWAGPGSASLQASAVAWQALAAQLGSWAAAVQAALDALTGDVWQGPSSLTMAASAAPYVVWMMATAAQCEQAAAAAASAATAFEAAHAGVVPPPLIEANRNLLITLVNTNFMGVNSGAIAATEGEYDQMWGQDAAVMYGYVTERGTRNVMIGLSQIAEAYINFGVIGAALLFFLLGGVYRGVDEVFGREGIGAGAQAVYLYHLSNLMITVDGSLAQVWGGVAQSLLLYGVGMAVLGSGALQRVRLSRPGALQPRQAEAT